jgi:hypothetical protein
MAVKQQMGGEGEGWQGLDALPGVSAMKRGIFMDVIGLEGQGKSSLALTLAEAGPVAYLDIDQSVDRARKPERKKERERVKVLPVRYGIGATQEVVKAECGKAWLYMRRNVDAAGWAKGAVIDTATEGWELLRLGSFGTLTPTGRRMDRLYGPVNAEYRQFIRSIYRTRGLHLITVHQLKDEYVDKMKDGEAQSVRTGNHVRAGFKEMGYLADIVVRCHRKKGEFSATIEVCKLGPNGPDLEGMEVEGENLSFLSIVAMATGTDKEGWMK